MRLPRRRPTDAELMSWLHTGAPSRIDKLLEDPDLTERLERLTELLADDVESLQQAVSPTEGFAERTETGVADRVSDLQRVGTLLGLLGLGAQTALTLTTQDDPDTTDAGDLGA